MHQLLWEVSTTYQTPPSTPETLLMSDVKVNRKVGSHSDVVELCFY